MALTTRERRYRIKKRIRKKISGSKDRPRMSVFRSNKQIYVQLIDDNTGETLISASSREKEVAEKQEASKSDQAKLVGKLIAEKALKQGINQVIFDRNGYLYHGRIKSLADTARENGLKF